MKVNHVLFLIIINEFCERFCFYSIKSTLYTFIIQSYGQSQSHAMIVLHSFVLFCYLFAFFGGIIADNYLGRYKTIIYFNIIYVVGNLLLIISSLKPNITFLFLGLFFISIGTGGIKPCISAFGGDQINKENTKNMEIFFSAFYFSINAGSLLGMVLSPILASKSCFGFDYCYFYAFRAAACMHFLSLLLFLFGSKSYVKMGIQSNAVRFVFEIYILPFFKWFKFNFLFRSPLRKTKSLTIKDNHSENAFLKNINKKPKIDTEVEIELKTDFKRCKEIFIVYIFASFFWMLFDQQSSSWISQTLQMKKTVKIFSFEFEVIPSQMQAINALAMVFMIPLFFKYLYPSIEKRGYNLHSIKKMYLGLFITAFSFFISAYLEFKIFNDKRISILWQIPQYLIITAGEVLVSITGLEFAYSQSPESLKSIVFSAWLATTALGNLYILILTSLDPMKIFNFFGERFKNQIMYGVIGTVAAVIMMVSTKNFKYNRSTGLEAR